jgi:hypothetical protein
LNAALPMAVCFFSEILKSVDDSALTSAEHTARNTVKDNACLSGAL